MNTSKYNSDMDSQFGETNEQIKISYDGREYIIPRCVGMKIGFISGMTAAGLVDGQALPLPSAQQVAQIGHKVLEFMSNNSNFDPGMDYLQKVVLGTTGKEYIQRIDKSDISSIRSTLEQVFELVSLSDYWDCPMITSDCAEFVALVLSKADQQSVRDWFGEII